MCVECAAMCMQLHVPAACTSRRSCLRGLLLSRGCKFAPFTSGFFLKSCMGPLDADGGLALLNRTAAAPSETGPCPQGLHTDQKPTSASQ